MHVNSQTDSRSSTDSTIILTASPLLGETDLDHIYKE